MRVTSQKRVAVAGAAIILAALTANAVGLDNPDAKPAESAPLPVDLKLVLSRKEEKKSGAVMTVSAKLTKKDAKTQINVGWTITYDGPRKPLIILEPSLENDVRGSTGVSVYVVADDGKAYRWGKTNPASPFLLSPYLSEKEWFVKANEKGVVSGSNITLDVEEIEEYFAANKIKVKSLTDASSEVYLQIYYTTNDRGEQYDLDAWTGRLISNTTKVTRPDR